MVSMVRLGLLGCMILFMGCAGNHGTQSDGSTDGNLDASESTDGINLEETTSENSSEVASSPCPKTVPADNGDCQPLEGIICNYINCADYGMASAACLNPQGIWRVSTEPCSSHSCGEETCKPDELCLITSSGIQMQECAANPCPGELISCDCAYPSCDPLDCVVSGNQVNCILCKTCP